MNIKIHENGWTVIVEDLDLKTATIEDIHTLGRLVTTNIAVVLRNQNLTPQDEQRILHTLGEVENFIDLKEAEPVWKSFIVPNTNDEILRVTGAPDDHGEEGLFGHVSDLDWHCNRPAQPNRMPVVWLYGISGTKGSRTSWTNGLLAYENATAEFLDELKDLQMICGYRRGNYTEMAFEHDNVFNEHYTPSVINVNERVGNRKSIFCPYLQVRNFVGMTEEESMPLLEKIGEYVTQDKYCYHHDWEDGDVVISDQTEAIHKRWAFDGMPTRLVHRGTCDLSKVSFDT